MKIWRYKKGNKNSNYKVKLMFIITGVVILMTALLSLITIIARNGNNGRVSPAISIISTIAVIAISVAVPFYVLKSSKLAKNNIKQYAFLEDERGQFWIFDYSKPAYIPIFEKYHTKEDERIGIGGILSHLVYINSSVVNKKEYIINYCNRTNIIEQIQKSNSYIGYANRIDSVKNIKQKGKITTITYIGISDRGTEYKGILTIPNDFEDMIGLLNAFERLK